MDPYILDLYKKIESDEAKTGTARHDLSHVLSVEHRVEDILNQLGCDKDYIEASKLAALLHDIGCIQGKKGHARRSYKMSCEYLKADILYRDEILSAICNHGSGFDSDSLMTLTLILADKLDLTKHRLAPEGYRTYGVSQLQYIEDIEISIVDQSLLVIFHASPKLDFEQLNTFKFLDKVFKAIDAFSRYCNLEWSVFMNDELWVR